MIDQNRYLLQTFQTENLDGTVVMLSKYKDESVISPHR